VAILCCCCDDGGATSLTDVVFSKDSSFLVVFTIALMNMLLDSDYYWPSEEASGMN